MREDIYAACTAKCFLLPARLCSIVFNALKPCNSRLDVVVGYLRCVCLLAIVCFYCFRPPPRFAYSSSDEDCDSRPTPQANKKLKHKSRSNSQTVATKLPPPPPPLPLPQMRQDDALLTTYTLESAAVQLEGFCCILVGLGL